MASRATKTSTNKKAAASKKAASPSDKAASRPRGQRGAQPVVEESFLDERTRRDILGVLLIVLGIALFAMVCLPGDAIVAGVVGTGLKLILGLGCYILPIVFVLIGVTFLLRFERNHVPARAALGMFCLFVALVGIFGCAAPVEQCTADQLFTSAFLNAYGGYVGNGIAYGGLMLFGKPVTVIVLLGLCLVSLLIIGWSLSALIERIRQRISDWTDSDEELDEAEDLQRGVSSSKEGKIPSISKRFGKLPPSAKEGTVSLESKEDNLKSMPTQEIAPATRKRPIKSLSLESLDSSASDGGSDKPLTRRLGAKKRSESLAVDKPAKGEKKVVVGHDADDGSGYQLPDMSVLSVSKKKRSNKESEETLRNTAVLLQQTLYDFGLDVGIAGWVAGPTVTLFKVELPSGVRVSRITNLSDDIALALAAPGVRIFSPIPGTNYVGVEVPNQVREGVLLGDVLAAAGTGKLEVAIGKDVEGNCVVEDLAKMPHVLIAGTTGSGKSVCVNSMIMSILMRATPDEVRFIMIDPKRVEFMPYSGIPHLYVPVVTEPKEASSALSWAVAEMERRLKIMSKAGAREIKQYNKKAAEGQVDSDGNTISSLPYIVIVIDELADLMMNVGKEVEFSISRLAQLARAAGIHLIIATQRPSTNVVTGLIKANITSRIALSVASGIDSRVILDATGAENLIGNGDMLFNKPELAKPLRIQGCFTDDKELEAVVSFLKEQGEPEYHNEILNVNVMSMGTEVVGNNGSSSNDDPLLWDAAELVVSSGFGSTSNIQRRFKVGYSRAGRIMDMLESKGVVGPANGSKPREVLIDTLELETLKAFETNDSQ